MKGHRSIDEDEATVTVGINVSQSQPLSGLAPAIVHSLCSSVHQGHCDLNLLVHLAAFCSAASLPLLSNSDWRLTDRWLRLTIMFCGFCAHCLDVGTLQYLTILTGG
ncbi:hypothetical protein E3N88_05283 [Mikania micrantha]|uniref:Uncharacterized protein n=1 Tax=Mikania micrantha TaxID=192012 RepID=A0A5N6PMR4_9ASTR|nr:hypothetical protein E3N88_05283 [Mikania micrantha]